MQYDPIFLDLLLKHKLTAERFVELASRLVNSQYAYHEAGKITLQKVGRNGSHQRTPQTVPLVTGQYGKNIHFPGVKRV